MKAEGIKYEEVPVEKLRWKCDLSKLDFQTTEDLKPTKKILGQERALKAIRLGLEMEHLGYNIFITGRPGTGRNTTVRMLLEGRKREGIEFDDKIYVNNFKNPDMPTAISLPAGQGKLFARDMKNLISTLRKKIPLIFESERYQSTKNSLIEESKNMQKEIVKEFEKKVKEENFALVQIQIGIYAKPEILPLIEGKPVNMDVLESLTEDKKLSEEEFARIKEKYEQLSTQLNEVSKKISTLEKELLQKLASLNNRMIAPLVEELISELMDRFENKKINAYLVEVKDNILNNIEKFITEKSEEKTQLIQGAPIPVPKNSFSEYEVNVLIDNSETKTSPLIFETTPNYKNLFGTIERSLDRFGHWTTDFRKIKAGSFLRANGGFLVLNALDTLREPGVWPTLKRALLHRKIDIETYDPFYVFTASALKPEPIECNTKVIMIGDPFIYYLLYDYDEDFKKIFKVKADFDSVTKNDEESLYQYACFVQNICQREKLLPFDKSGIAAVIEYAVRLAGRQNKISTQFNDLVDILREANYWAKNDNRPIIQEEHVDKAIAEKIERLRLLEEKIQEMIEEGTIMIDCQGKVVGQVNGLSVYELGEYSFGKPSRITAKTAVGRAGIINIEREADLSGKTHNKGVLILSGYLRSKYAQDKPLTIDASICFEQSYSGVEGDSASSSEVYALLSSLADLPLRQDIAVTGSINQKGEIQPIGGVNQKIEGFFDVCKAKGLTGTQGVLIPALNIPDLMLRKDIVKAIKEGKFHLYPIKTIDEGIEILTGVKAGERQAEGNFEKDTVNYLVDKKLREFANKLKEFGKETKE